MLKQVYEIDENGYLKDILVKEFDKQGNCTEELPPDIITVDPPQGLYRPKWAGSEWIETMTETEYITTLPELTHEIAIEDRISAIEDVILNLL